MTSNAYSHKVLLYLHLPKTAGTTLTSCIYDGCCSPSYYRAEGGRLHSGIYYFPGNFHKDANPAVPTDVSRALKRTDINAVVGHFTFGIHGLLARQATYVTVLRHPLTRVLSLFHHICTYKSHGWRSDVLSKGMSIETFIETYRCREADNDQTRRLSGMEPPFGECTREMFDLAKSNLDNHFAVVGITERFDETLVLIRRTFGWPQELAYWPRLVNKNRPSPETLSQASLDVVLKRNELDMELYRYASAKLESQIGRQTPGFQEEVATLVDRKRRVAERVAPQEVSPTEYRGSTA